MTTDKRIPISERALMARINRRLAKEEPWPLKLCKTRPGSMAENNLGTYHTVNTYRNSVEDYRIEDLEGWARENYPELLKPYEALSEGN